MKAVVILVGAFIALVQAEGIIKPSEYKRTDSGRVVGGEEAANGQFPWQAGITYTRNDGALLFCAGALISEQFVLTAGHCAVNAVSFDIFLGSATLNSEEEGAKKYTVDAANSVLHPQFDADTLNYDVALIRLPEPVEFSATLTPIRYPPPGERASEGFETYISGWGLTENSSSIVSQLQYAPQSVISNEDCAAIYGTEIVIDATLCSLGPEGTESPCNGDSGAPLVYLEEEVPTLHGTVSFLPSSGCGSGFPAGYVRISSVTSWIDGVLIDYEDVC